MLFLPARPTTNGISMRGRAKKEDTKGTISIGYTETLGKKQKTRSKKRKIFACKRTSKDEETTSVGNDRRLFLQRRVLGGHVKQTKNQDCHEVQHAPHGFGVADIPPESNAELPPSERSLGGLGDDLGRFAEGGRLGEGSRGKLVLFR